MYDDDRWLIVGDGDAQIKEKPGSGSPEVSGRLDEELQNNVESSDADSMVV